MTQTTGLPAHAEAAVTYPGGRTVVERFPFGPTGEDDGWLRVEASGVCGTDVSLAHGGLTEPTVLGHHVVGRVAIIGLNASARWGVHPGDLVALEEYLPCGSCAECSRGLYRLCPETDLWGRGRRVGLIPTAQAPALWGGNGQYMYLPPTAVMHRLPEGLPLSLAVWTQPLANAVDWITRVGRLAPDDTVVILGPGYHGLAAAAVALHGGARRVLVGGTALDGPRLAIARAIGAGTFRADSPDAAARVRKMTGGHGADLVLDTAGSEASTVSLALEMLVPQGRLVLAAIKKGAITMDSEGLVRSMHSITGVRGRNPESVRTSIQLLQSGGIGLAAVPTHGVPLSGVGDLLDRLHRGQGPKTPHAVVLPWSPEEAHDCGSELPKESHEQVASIL